MTKAMYQKRRGWGMGRGDSNTLHQSVGEMGRNLQIGNYENYDFTV